MQHKSPLLVLALAFGAYFGAAGVHWFEFNRDALNDFQLWRLLTSHFYHTNLTHLLLNCFAVILLWTMHGHFYRAKTFILLFLTCALCTGVGLLLFSSLNYYVGLSGVLHGIFYGER